MDQTLPRLHLWVYNHPLEGISDQIEFFFLLMKQNGYNVSLSRKPRLDALNIVIENFSEITSQTLINFCEESGKRVAIIMTEHLDLFGNELLIHGDRLWTKNDYMHPSTQVARIKNLLDCIPYLRVIFVLGDLPLLQGSDRIFPGVPIRNLPFPSLSRIDISKQTPEKEVVFSGAETDFRRKVLKRIKKEHSLALTTQFLPRKDRNDLNRSARIALNIPQRPGWGWLSLMRIIAALNCGRATVSIETQDNSWISRCCIQLPEAAAKVKLGEIIEDWQGAYITAHENYEKMRQDFLSERGFPYDLFELWALLEKKWL